MLVFVKLIFAHKLSQLDKKKNSTVLTPCSRSSIFNTFQCGPEGGWGLVWIGGGISQWKELRFIMIRECFFGSPERSTSLASPLHSFNPLRINATPHTQEDKVVTETGAVQLGTF